MADQKEINVSLLNHQLKLIDLLCEEENPVKRTAMYEQLKLISETVGLPTPPLEDLEVVNPYKELLENFWNFYQENSDDINHANDPEIIAINPTHSCKLFAKYCEQDLSTNTLRKALTGDERYIDNATVKSRITGKTVRCYRFKRN